MALENAERNNTENIHFSNQAKNRTSNILIYYYYILNQSIAYLVIITQPFFQICCCFRHEGCSNWSPGPS